MAILTKPLSGVVAKKPEEAPVDADLQLIKDQILDEEASCAVEGVEDEAYVRGRGRREGGPPTRCCLMVSLVVFVVLMAIAGLHIHKVLAFNRAYRYSGNCHLPLRTMFPTNQLISAHLEPNSEDSLLAQLSQAISYPREIFEDEPLMFGRDMANLQESRTHSNLENSQSLKNGFEFDFDVDVENGEYELVELPEIFLGRYMHDFKANYTVIIDRLGSNCFIMNLDRNLVPPPRNMFDMLNKINHGLYDINFQEVRKNYRIINDVLEDLTGFGQFIPRSCSDKRSYRLEELVGEVVVKREVAKLEKFGEFTGTTLLQYHIVNLAHAARGEQHN